MANKFTITITAVDQATRRIQAIGKSISATFKPVGMQIGRVLTTARAALAPLTSIATTLAAIAGIGTVAGIAALTMEWGKMGLNITNTAMAIGVGALALQSWRGAAVLAGLEAGAIAQGLASLGDRFEDIKFFRDPQGYMILRKLGIQIHSLKDGSIDAERGLMDLSRAIAGTRNVQSQRLIARQFGVEALLPLLQKGPAAIRAYRAEAERLNPVTQRTINEQERFGKSMARMQWIFEGIKNQTLPGLVQAMEPLIGQFTNWVQGSDARKFFTDLGTSIGTLPAKLNNVAKAFGGWKNIAIGIGAIITASLLAPVVSLAFEITKLAGAMLLLGVRSLPILALLGIFATAFDITSKAMGRPGFIEQSKSLMDSLFGSLGERLGIKPGALSDVGGLFAGGGAAPSPSPLNQAGINSMDDLGAGPAENLSRQVQVDVRFHNAPPGTTATARSGSEPVPIRVGHAMAPGGG